MALFYSIVHAISSRRGYIIRGTVSQQHIKHAQHQSASITTPPGLRNSKDGEIIPLKTRFRDNEKLIVTIEHMQKSTIIT